uniref:hypothetical protein n=1 Tax=Alloprevotella sp. TaxID=1872471 RepID=UPI003FEDE353
MKKIFTFLMGLFALCGSISADEVVDYLTDSPSEFKAYKIEVRRGPSGTSFSDNSSTPGFMLCNPNDANDDKAYSTWYEGTKFYNVAYNADAQYQHFLILKYAGHFYVVNMGNKKFLATADGTTVRFSADATPVNIDTYGTDANYRYFIVTEDGHQINFNSYNTTTGVTGTGTSKDAGSLISLSTTGTCSLTAAELSAVKEKITGWKESYKTELSSIPQDKLGTLGYPTEDAYNTYKGVLNTESSTRSQVNTAKNTFLQSIVYPQDGQAYYIKGINKSSNAGYVYSTDENKLGFKGSIPTEMPSTAIFYCHKVGERKYVFTNNNGRYMRYRTDNSSDGFTDGYDEALNVWTLQPMRSGNSDSYDINRDNLNADFSTLGLFLMRAKRNDHNWNEDFYLMAGFSGNQFHAASATTVYYTASNQTSAFQLEAVPQQQQQNKIKTTALTVGTVSANIATYSSPFPVKLPKGVDAYIAKQEGENIVLQQITGALPANTGVILSSETTNEYIPTARTTEALATVNAADNKLVATTGNAVPADVTVYILGKDNNNNSKAVFKKLSSNALNRTIAQYKAYLTLDGTQSAQLMNFAFAGSDLTGIQNVTETSAKSKTAYDLAGRKVGKLQKGIYIVNGKKVIVK